MYPRMALLAIATLLLNNCLVYSSPISYAGHGAGSDSRGGAIDFSVDDTGSSLHVYREHSPGLTLRKDVVKGSRTPSTTAHDVIFLVKQRNMDELTRILHDISDPRSENYGNHMTSSEIIDLTSNPESHDETVAYLTAAGATIVLVEHAGGSITARAPISLWESMLNTEFFTYSMSIEHAVVHDVEDPTATSFSFVRTEKYSVPIGLDAHVAHVMNTVQLPELRTSKAPPIRYPVNEKAKSSRFSTDSLLIGGYLTPQSIINLYNIDNTTGHPRAIQAAYETVGQAYAPEDTDMFQDVMRIQKRSVIASYGNKSVSAAWCKASGYTICAESNIDLQYMMGLANTPTIHWYTDKPMAWYLFALVYAPKQPPLVISMSYGSEEQYMSVSEYNTFEESAKKLSVMGVTILVAAGDDGAAPHTARNNEANCKYMPMFPTSCPYVISVGATQGASSGVPETVCQHDRGGGITSGGGMSTLYRTPYYQREHVDTYFSTVMGTVKEPYPGFARNGRGYPDLAAAGQNYIFFIGGQMLGGGGTSISCPVVAAMISLVNAARMRAGGRAVGWIHPILYGHGASFINDITFGDNRCTALRVCCKGGFHATKGWDPTSGLGTLNFARFRDFMMDIKNLPVITEEPTQKPTPAPTNIPTPSPTRKPTATPTSKPSAAPTDLPTVAPTSKPSSSPTRKPTFTPTAAPTNAPTVAPTSKPSSSPTRKPTFTPTAAPTAAPTSKPSSSPTRKPTFTPTAAPTDAPTAAPTSKPSSSPTRKPTFTPTNKPTAAPTDLPTSAPIASNAHVDTKSAPSSSPSAAPSSSPSAAPTPSPSAVPSTKPSAAPTSSPSAVPSAKPSAAPTSSPSAAPTSSPSAAPTSSPSAVPSSAPNATPTSAPSAKPNAEPTSSPSAVPSAKPSAAPTSSPSAAPTSSPSAVPSAKPSAAPTSSPSVTPTSSPSAAPTSSPSAVPSAKPSAAPTSSPSVAPTSSPSVAPTSSPSAEPTSSPSQLPSMSPIADNTDSNEVPSSDVSPSIPDDTAQPTSRPEALFYYYTESPSAKPTRLPTIKVRPSRSPTNTKTRSPTKSRRPRAFTASPI